MNLFNKYQIEIFKSLKILEKKKILIIPQKLINITDLGKLGIFKFIKIIPV